MSFAFCLPVLAGSSPIGMVTSNGEIEISRVRMPGTATLYEGAIVETGNSPAQLSLRNGSVVRLSGGAKATIRSNMLLLERGVGQVDTPGDYAVRARAVTLIPTSHPSRARLQLSDGGELQVAALSGSFEVRRAGASSIIATGNSLSFAAGSAEAGAVAPSQFKGCLVNSDHGLLLYLDRSKTHVILKGGSMNAKAGDRVTVVGKRDTIPAPLSGGNEVIQVLRLTVDSHGCSTGSEIAAGAAGAGAAVGASAAGAGAAAGASAAGAGAAAAGAAGAAVAGMTATTVAIIGVAAASAALIPTIALTGGSSSSNSGISPSSR